MDGGFFTVYMDCFLMYLCMDMILASNYLDVFASVHEIYPFALFLWFGLGKK